MSQSDLICFNCNDYIAINTSNKIFKRKFNGASLLLVCRIHHIFTSCRSQSIKNEI
ncbi:hypothetical protein PUN28_002292 [Cardiocondyla obscurior]|uniref:Uncharacterized protein n=1 Tax=Cardiocondyla obscurior TaxID=286306 RepID=A0AAW2GTH4_9HYME